MTTKLPELPVIVQHSFMLLDSLQIHADMQKQDAEIASKNVEIWLGNALATLMEHHQVQPPDFLKLWRPSFGTLMLKGLDTVWDDRPDGAPPFHLTEYVGFPKMVTFVEAVLRATIVIELMNVENISTYQKVGKTHNCNLYQPLFIDGTPIADCTMIDTGACQFEVFERTENGSLVRSQDNNLQSIVLKGICLAYHDPLKTSFF